MPTPDNTTPTIPTAIEAAITAALAAGTEVMAVYAREFSVTEKEDRSPLTEADTRAHRTILRILAAATPELPVLSEEGATIPGETRRAWDRYWLVDPLDGTKEFIKKNDEFTVNIALLAADHRRDAAREPRSWSPIAGVVYAPATRQLYIGVTGRGAWRIEVPHGEPTADPPTLREIEKHGTPLPSLLDYADRPFTVVASRSHRTPETDAYIEELRAAHRDLTLVSAGSSLKICRVAEGSADTYPRFAPTMEWDTAAGDAVARAAGCRVQVWDADPTGPGPGPGAPVTYNKEDLHNPWFLVTRK